VWGMECSVIRDWLIDYRENELRGRRKAAVESHLKLCAGCRAELGALEELVAEIARIPAVDPWPGFSRRLQSRLDRDGSSPPGGWGWRHRAAGTSAWIAGGMLLLVVIVVVYWLFLASGRLFLSIQRSHNGDTATVDVSKGALGGTELKQMIDPWEGSGWSMDKFEDGPDGLLSGLALGSMQAAPDEVMTLWNRDIVGANSLEQLVEIPAPSDAQIEEVLDQVRR